MRTPKQAGLDALSKYATPAEIKRFLFLQEIFENAASNQHIANKHANKPESV